MKSTAHEPKVRNNTLDQQVYDYLVFTTLCTMHYIQEDTSSYLIFRSISMKSQEAKNWIIWLSSSTFDRKIYWLKINVSRSPNQKIVQGRKMSPTLHFLLLCSSRVHFEVLANIFLKNTVCLIGTFIFFTNSTLNRNSTFSF